MFCIHHLSGPAYAGPILLKASMREDSFLGLCITVLLIGIKHGLDADHIATIQSLTQFNTLRTSRIQKHCGVLFCIGHGSIVLLIALTSYMLQMQYNLPSWLERVGGLISIACLLLLGTLNLRELIRTKNQEPISTVGLKSTLVKNLLSTTKPWPIVAIGALFAISLDTISHAFLFSVSGSSQGAWQYVAILACTFTFGMLVVGGMSGMFLNNALISQTTSTRKHLLLTRALSMAVVAMSFSVAGVYIAHQINA